MSHKVNIISSMVEWDNNDILLIKRKDIPFWNTFNKNNDISLIKRK